MSRAITPIQKNKAAPASRIASSQVASTWRAHLISLLYARSFTEAEWLSEILRDHNLITERQALFVRRVAAFAGTLSVADSERD